MWEDVVYTKAQAKYKFQQIGATHENFAPRQVKKAFVPLRDTVLEGKIMFLKDETKKINSYAFDLYMGFILYRLLKEDYGFSERLAAQDEVWRYLSLEILPDLVYERCGMNDQRFYKESRRIWLKTIWWYIHLSWQGTEEKTRTILKNNTSDEILQLVDRLGDGGYRVELTREIIRQLNMDGNNKVPRLLRRVLKLNTVRVKMIEPTLSEGGIESYVADLYKYFSTNFSKVEEKSR